MDWFVEFWFYFGAMSVVAVPLFFVCVGRARPVVWWGVCVAVLAVALVVAGFPAVSVLTAAAAGLLLGAWGIAELA